MRNIRSYHFLHSGPVINRIIPDAIKMGVPEINVFLDSRLVPSVHLQSGTLSKQAILEDLAEECQGFKYGLAIADAWEDKNSLCKKLFDPSEFKKPITIKYLDIPELHLNTKIGIEFWDAVSESDDLSLFDTKAIQILINYKWSIIKPKVFNRYLYPYLLFLLCFSTWSNFLYQKRTDEGYVAINYGLTIVLVLFSCYFMIGEIKQLYITGPSYFLDAWNFLDIVPLVLVTTTSSWASFDVLLAGNKDIYTETGEVYRDYLISFAALLMWFKFVYFMRCTENTGWLVRMLVEVMKELQSFLLIYAITIVAFADAFNSLSNSQVSELMTKPFELDKDGNNTTVPMNKEYAQTNGGFVDGWPSAFIYTYTLTLGEFGSSNESIVYPNQFVFGSPLCYLYFFICSLLNLIVMLNLLIAVISDTHSRVTDKQDQLRFQELSRIITDYLFLDDRTEVQLVKQIDQFLIIAMESDKKEKDEEDLGFIDVMTSLKQMKHEEQRAFEDCKLSLKDNQKKLDSFADKQADMMDDMNNSMEFDESDEEADY